MSDIYYPDAFAVDDDAICAVKKSAFRPSASKCKTYQPCQFNKYATTNDATCSVKKSSFRTFDASKCKSQREDFNDMFAAEANARHEAGDLSIVFVLTYNDEHIRHKYGQNMLDSADLARFAKSSKWSKMLRRSFGYVFDFVSVGEYGNGGESHNYKGQRGVGQNPHYHCAGWFHKVADVSSDVMLAKCKELGIVAADATTLPPLSDVLPLLVRLNWQGCLENDPYKYGRSAHLRSLGLGRVELDGPIGQPKGREMCSRACGGRYISKYIGKDIKTMWYKAYKMGFCPAFLSMAVSAVSDCIFGRFLSENVSKFFLPLSECLCDVSPDSSSAVLKYEYCMRVIRHWAFNRRRWIKGDVDCYRRNYEYDHSRLWQRDFGLFFKWIGVDDMELPKELATFFPAVCDALDDCYCDFYDEFNEDLNGRYSPKVRKFHGFGYSLLGDADLSDGTYLVNTARRVVNRQLPPSLRRKAFYDFHVVFSRDALGCPKKSVKYTLNDVGRAYLKNVTSTAIDIDLTLARDKGSENLKKNAEKAAIFRNCLASFDVLAETFNSFHLLGLLVNRSAALEHCLSCRQADVYWANVSENRWFFDVKNALADIAPDVFSAYEELDKIHVDSLKAKERKDADFNACWLRTYNHSY